MVSPLEKEKQKLMQDRCQQILGNLLREEDNKYCVDCDAKGPRWASLNLGIFLCIRCAGIHRNLGCHISRVKSVNLDTWTPEQVACLQQMGNSKARAVYEANLPENFRRPQFDSSLEAFIRAKYEHKKYIAKEWVPPPAPPPAFDIEEEKRKEKERRLKTKSKIGSAIELNNVPQHHTAVPRPHSTGPHFPAVQETPKPIQQVPDSCDLLNLGDISSTAEGTIFDAFLSETSATKEILPAAKKEHYSNCDIHHPDADFFNQKMASFEQKASLENKSSKMTKESILSLYGSNTVQMPPAQQIAPPVYGVPVPGGLLIGQQGYAPRVGYSPFPVQAIIPCTVTQQMANLQLSGQAGDMGLTAVSPNPPTMGPGVNQTSTGIAWPSNRQSPNFSNNLWQ